MKIPTKVKIGAHEYSVRFEDVDGDSDARFGHAYPRKLQIYIDERAAKSQQEETFFHEVLHAIVDQVKCISDDKDEERIVQALGHGIYQMLKENNLLK